MRKAISNERFGRGWLVAASLAFTLAAFGCTSNQMAGNGQPATVTPTINSTDHAVTSGSSSGTEGNPPMASSFTYGTTTYTTPRVDVDALANLAAERGYEGVVLGPVDPQGHEAGVTVTGGTYVSPALSVNPAQTINSSISSPGGGEAITGGPITPVSALGTTAAPLTAAALGTALPAGSMATSGAVAGSAAFSPVLMNSTPPPQPTGTTAPTLATLGATGTATVTTVGGSLLPGVTNRGTTATATVAPRTAASTLRTASVTGNISGIQIQTTSGGGLVMTNVGTGGAAAGHH